MAEIALMEVSLFQLRFQAASWIVANLTFRELLGSYRKLPVPRPASVHLPLKREFRAKWLKARGLFYEEAETHRERVIEFAPPGWRGIQDAPDLDE